MAVTEGRIAAVGAAEDIQPLAGPETRTLDLGGGLVVPGLVDAHEHVVWPDPAGVRLELSAEGPMPDPSWTDVTAAVESAAEEVPEGAWIHGRIGPAVLSQEAFEVPLERLPQTRSLPTLVCGKMMHAEGELAGVQRRGRDPRRSSPRPPGISPVAR